ncbi:putative siderophore transport system permease protein YfhA [Paenibacillus plantiphilus]|uniref:Siderophore transport system permease protein YfhA n=1 Tax=Paenibacillus plantiphilus TaxID=2905650 RepID=A0ABM9C0Y1_9BACL|nr:iron ABC transporter permease [Paenibacillus plantiphilus]CAH1199201.1 putative siderophore transport system permease protein YfhA [Paenibacillus plantiphilus]
MYKGLSMGNSGQARRFLLTIVLLMAVLAVLIVLHIALGKVMLTPMEVIHALFNHNSDEGYRHIVFNLRLPRVLIAITAGLMLGTAGAILQVMLRNPLVEPGLIGASAGSVLCAVLWITYGSQAMALSPEALPFAALGGGICAVVAVYMINGSRGGEGAGLALTGIIVTAILQAGTSLILLKNQQGLTAVFLWNFGSLNGRVWTQWNMLWPWAIVCLPLAMAFARRAGALQLGDSVATGIGLAIQRTRLILLIIAAALTAATVSVIGAIGFIGLIGPHIAKLLVGRNTVYLFPTSALLSSVLLVGADWVGQSITFKLPIPGMENHLTNLPVGAVTTLMGAPFFLYLLRKTVIKK